MLSLIVDALLYFIVSSQHHCVLVFFVVLPFRMNPIINRRLFVAFARFASCIQMLQHLLASTRRSILQFRIFMSTDWIENSLWQMNFDSAATIKCQSDAWNKNAKSAPFSNLSLNFQRWYSIRCTHFRNNDNLLIRWNLHHHFHQQYRTLCAHFHGSDRQKVSFCAWNLKRSRLSQAIKTSDRKQINYSRQNEFSLVARMH